jgi:hypothetical protein
MKSNPHKVDRCEKCSKNIEDVEATDYEGRQVFDIPLLLYRSLNTVLKLRNVLIVTILPKLIFLMI